MEWAKVKDKLPEEDRDLIATDGEEIMEGQYHGEGKGKPWDECDFWDDDREKDIPPTHWIYVSDMLSAARN